MANDIQAPSSRPLDAVLHRLSARGVDEQGRQTFARALLGSVDEATLSVHSVDELVVLVGEALDFIQSKPLGASKIAVRRQRDGVVLEILNQDMPFLLDSVSAELHTHSLDIELVLHPLFKTERTTDGKLVQVVGPGDRRWDDGRQESYIAIHLARLPDVEVDKLVGTLTEILGEVRTAVADWQPMLARLRRAIGDLAAAPKSVPSPLRDEAVAFLQWLEEGNITLLGMREYRLDGDMQTGDLSAGSEAGLGLLRDPNVLILRRGSEFVALTPEIRSFYLQSDPLIITKANVRSRVHRRGHMDYIGVKTYRPDGTLAGELRIVGLFTSQAYVKPPFDIPNSAAQGRDGHAARGVSAGESRGQVSAQRARYISARRAVPDQR